jgi:hypothetical protein
MPGYRVTSDESAALGNLGRFVDCERVRLYRGDSSGVAGLLRKVVLRLSRNRAIALGNHVFLPDRWEGDLPTLAHELTHCGQYQAWGPWVYFARGASAQVRDLLHRTLGIGASPYKYSAVPAKPFKAYGMEQQGQIVEDCYRGLPAARAISPFRPGRQT